MEDIKVKISSGEVVLRKPTAGVRNKALINAETDTGFKKALMMVELLPPCVKTHPWGMTPIRQALDNLSIEDYDELINGLETLITPDEDLKKKLNLQSSQEKKESIGQQV